MSTAAIPPKPQAPKIELVGLECGLHMGPAIVHAKAPGEMFGVTLNDAMHMIDEFAEPGRTFLLDVKAAFDRLANVHPMSPLLYRETDVSWRFISRPPAPTASSATTPEKNKDME